MILKLDQQDGIKIGAEGLQMGIDLSDPAKIFYILSQGFYKNPKRAIIQELTSNIYDSVVASGKNIFEYPGYIVLTEQSITFKDFGEGISEERMEKIMSKFFATTKAKDPNLIGVMGLGFKSIFGYSSQFTVVSVYDKVKRTWLFSKDNAQIDIIKLNEEESSEENQTSFIVPIKYDAKSWYQEVVKTIPYFKGIIFDCQIITDRFDNWNQSKAFNESQLLEGKTFFFRTSAPKNFHICLDQVIYELSTSELGIYLNNFPFGLKFSTSEGITPLPNRESLMMSESTKALILKRLAECLEELHEYYEEKSLTLPEYFQDSSNLKFEIAGNTILLGKNDINDLCDKLDVKSFIKFSPIFADISNLYNKSYFFYDCLDCTGQIGKSKILTTRYFSNRNITKVMLAKGLTPAQNRFLRENYEGWYLGKINKQKFWGSNGFYRSLSLESIPRDKWRTIVEAWIEEQKTWLSQTSEFPKEDYEEWLSNQVRNKPTRRKYDVEEIRFNHVERKLVGQGLKLVPTVIKGSDFSNKHIYIYSDVLDFQLSQLRELPRVIPIIIDAKNLAKLKQIKGITVLSPEKFEKTKYFKKLVFEKWVAGNARVTSMVVKNCFNQYNGILRIHYEKTEWLRRKGNENLPDFLTKYELDSKYKPIEKFFADVIVKAEKLTIPQTEYYYRHDVAKKLFVCKLKCNRLEKELNKLKNK